MTTTRRRSKTLLPISLSLSAVSSFRFFFLPIGVSFGVSKQAWLFYANYVLASFFCVAKSQRSQRADSISSPFPAHYISIPGPPKNHSPLGPFYFLPSFFLLLLFFFVRTLTMKRGSILSFFFRALPIQYQGSPP